MYISRLYCRYSRPARSTHRRFGFPGSCRRRQGSHTRRQMRCTRCNEPRSAENTVQILQAHRCHNHIGGSWTAGFGPDDMGLVPLLYIYNLGVPGGRPGNRMGYASAMSWVMFFVVFATSKLLNEKLAKAWVASEYE